MDDDFLWRYRSSFRYDALNEELTRNEQRHFGDTERLTERLHDNFAEHSPPGSWPPASRDAGVQTAREADGYMHRPSAFSLERPSCSKPPTQQDFLECFPPGNATLTYQDDAKKLQSIPSLNLDIIGQSSAVLAMAFEESRSGPRLYLETLTSSTVYPFLRFLYTGTYALNGLAGDMYEDVPTSVLHHCQLYKLGDIYELEELKTQAYVNVIRQCEFGCSSPDKPIDLCAAIRYIYKELPKHEALINTIIDYCVQCFLNHGLGQDAEFKKMAYELRKFHQALCMNSRDRGFDHDAAAAIIQLPYKPYVPETYASRDDDVFANRFDDVFHFHDDLDSSPKKRKRPDRFAAHVEELSKLPIRSAQAPSTASENRTIFEELDYRFGIKRRASSIAGSSAPLPVAVLEADQTTLPLRPHAEPSRAANNVYEGELTKALKSAAWEDAEDLALSDNEFEIVQQPLRVEEVSDSDSDSNTLVEVTRENAQPLRSPSRESTLFEMDAVLVNNDSDSEWQLL